MTKSGGNGPTTRPNWFALIGIGVALTLIGSSLGAVLALSLSQRPGGCDTERVAAQALPAVVTVIAKGSTTSGSGSGAIISSDGVILTNDHVIVGGTGAGASLAVLLNDGQQLPAKLVGTDPLTDLAVLKIDRTGLPTLPLAPTEPLQVGRPVVAIGAPLGLSGTVTSGIISALNRNVPAPKASGGTTVLLDSLQTDAAINPGNSGGPLVTCSGKLIGVNTAISTVPDSQGVAGGGSVGIGFAVPASTAQRISEQILASGRADHPWLGMSVAEISADIADRFGAKAGLYVQSVDSDGPAAQAGVRPGDVITAIGAKPASSTTLSLLLLTARVGEQVAVSLTADGQTRETQITFAEQPRASK